MLVPADQVDTIVPVKPRRCRRCAAPLHGMDAAPGRHQVTELPPLRPHITEYQLHTLACARCCATTAAALPAGVPRGAFGPQLEATVAVCTGVYHLSRRTTVELMADLFGVELALGTVTACEQAVSAAAAEPVAEAHRYVQQQEVVHADETGWRQGRQRAWLWGVGTHSAAGSRFAERMLTVATTLKQQGRHVVDYVAPACLATLHGQPPPSLLPDATSTRSRRLAPV